jgi:hypothetical protein
MRYLKKHSNNRHIQPLLVNEFNSFHKSEVMKREKDFTVSYEIELEARSQYTDIHSIIETFENIFHPLLNKWNVDLEYDSTLIDRGQPDEVSIGNIYSFDDYDTDMANYESKLYEYTNKYSDDYFSGIEIVPLSYFNGINEAFQYLDHFYSIYNKQKTFVFSDRTGLHTNIGFRVKSDWNLVKGYLLFNEDKMAYRGFEMRKFNEFSSSYKKQFEEKVVEYCSRIKNFSHDYIIKNVDKLSSDLSRLLELTVVEIGEKYVGFNISKVKKLNYIEFRHPGGKVKAEDLKEQTLHYANIVLACIDSEYRKKDYIKKLINFLSRFVA